MGQDRFEKRRLGVAAFALALGFLGATAANSAQPAGPSGWLSDGVAVHDRPDIASLGEFGVMQIATTDPEKLMTDWATNTPGVQVATASEMTRNQPIVTFLVFRGCKADAAGNCNVTVDFETLGPSGASYNRTPGAPVWVAYPAPPATAVQLSSSGYGLKIEDKDPLGPYIVRATVTDHIANITLHTQATLTAVAQ